MVKPHRNHELYGCYSKLERARSKRTEFSALASTYLAETKYRIDFDEMPGDLIHVVLRAEKAIEDELHHTAAELIYHLRSLLDQMWVAVVKADGLVPNKSTMLPAMKYENEFAVKMPPGLSKGIADLLYHERPWSEGGDPVFTALQRLSNVDKHNFLIPFGAPLTGLSISGGVIDGGGHPESVGIMIGGGNERADLTDGYLLSKIGKNGSYQPGPISIQATIAFGENAGPVAHQDALPVFDAMIDKAASVLGAFHSHCFPE